MKKKLLALIMAGMLLASGTGVHANEYSERQQRIADALNHVELFLGTNIGYELGRELTRVEGITLLVRLLGQEEAAVQKTYRLPFKDVADWAKPYVGYAYENGITLGISDTEFGSNTTMTDYMFITLILRALDYKDTGRNPQFVWNEPYKLAKSIGLIGFAEADTFFTRGDAIEVFWNALSGDEYALANSLKNRGVFSAQELDDAIEIYQYGKDAFSASGTSQSGSGSTGNTGSTGSGNSSEFDWEDWYDWGNDLPFIDDTPPSDKNDQSGSQNNSSSGNQGNNGNSGSSGGNSGNSGSTGNSGSDTKPDTGSSGENSGNSGSADNEMPRVPYEPAEVSYQDYLDMSAAEQQAFIMTFSDPADFFAWLNEGKAAYEAANPSIEIDGSGSIDIGDLIGKDNDGN